jgi:hypothetical protein
MRKRDSPLNVCFGSKADAQAKVCSGWKADIAYLAQEQRNLPARAAAYGFAPPLL